MSVRLAPRNGATKTYHWRKRMAENKSLKQAVKTEVKEAAQKTPDLEVKETAKQPAEDLPTGQRRSLIP